jgi:hypothetical protein
MLSYQVIAPVNRRSSFEPGKPLQTESSMRRVTNFYELRPEDRRTQRLWAQRIAILYGAIALVAFAALAVGEHRSPTNQAAAGGAAVASVTITKTTAGRPR